MADAEVEQAPVEQGSIAEDVPALQEPAKKAFVKRTTKPSAENLREKVASLESTISDAKATIEKIRQEMDGRKRRREGDGESQGIRNQLQELRTQFQQVLAQKQAVRAELEGATKARDALRTQVRGMKGKMEYTTVEKIDEQMARLESRLQHTSMPLAEEKKVLEDIKKLRASRAGVAQYNEKLERLSGNDDCGTIVERLKALDEQLSGIKAQEEGLRKQLSEIRARDDARNVDIPKLQQERDDAREVIRLAIEKIKQLRAEHREKHEEWWQGEQSWREQRARDKARRDEEYVAIRAEREKERKARQAELAGEPFNKEVTLCEQVQAYLSRFQSDSDKAAAEAPAKADIAPLQGMAIYSKKKVEDDNPYASLEKKSKKGRKAEKRAAQPPVEKPLNHSFDILTAFGKLKIEAPLSTAKVADATAAVKERLAYYLKKQEEAKANPENGAADFEADGEAADKADAPPKAAAAAQPRAQAQQAPYVGGDEPTPAEAAGGRAPAPEDGPPAQNGSAQSAQGAWASGDAAAAPATEPEAGTGGGGVSVGLSHSEDGSVSVKLTVSEEQ